MTYRPSICTDIAAIRLCSVGNTRRWTTGIPIDQQTERRSRSRTYGCVRRIAFRNSSAFKVGRGASEVDAARNLPSAVPNDVIAESSSLPSPERCLNRASSRQMNLGSWLSSRREWGSSPSFRAIENRNSVWADVDSLAALLHQSGQAALIAASLRPTLFRRFLS